MGLFLRDSEEDEYVCMYNTIQCISEKRDELILKSSERQLANLSPQKNRRRINYKKVTFSTK